MKKHQSFHVYKKQLDNGLNILVRPTKTIPEVVVHLWYNVGSKDENDGERGMAHLIEHMIFKGTKKLSENDINFITTKLSGYANAFTSNDYTGYIFKFPSNVWQESLVILSDCMQHARFDEQMLNSEVQAVIQELKLYKDDYQTALIERMLSNVFPQHPYQYPIIGYKQDLLDLNRDNLYAFYKKHYHPGNATLVIVGDVTRDDAFEKAEKYFGKIKPGKESKKIKRFFLNDLFNTSVTLPREVETPWSFYAYKIPGLASGNMYLFNMIESLLGQGRSSRLYEKLVRELRLATAVGCFSYDLFEKGLLTIYVQPLTVDLLPRIETIIDQEIARLIDSPIEDWEFLGVKNKATMAYCSLLENIDQQASIIGSSFLATGDTQYLSHYMENLEKTTKTDVQAAIKKYLKPCFKHSGYLLPWGEPEKELWAEQQEQSDTLDREILKDRQRKTPVEGGKYVMKVKDKPLPEFIYPSPDEFFLNNGLEVVALHNPGVPKISILLGMQANYLDEPTELGGMSRFMYKLLLEGTEKYSGKELNRYLETQGMSIFTESGIIGMELLSKDFEKGIDILYQIVDEPAFNKEAIEKVRQQMLMELQEFWDTPTQFINLLAKQVIYKGHPYSKLNLGYKECITHFSREQITDFYKKFMTPEGAVMVVVGDLSQFGSTKNDRKAALQKLLEEKLKFWKGGHHIDELIFPEISYSKPQTIHHPINRDQVVLALAAPSVSRCSTDYESMSALDFIVTGAGISSSSLLFQLREQTGMFYSIGGSLLYGAGRAPGMILIKTLVSVENVKKAEELIKNAVKIVRERGISPIELEVAAKSLMTASVSTFENSARIARTFLFYKKCGLNLDLFDKRGALLSILKIGAINNIARRYCKENFLSTIRVGRNV